MTDLDPTEPRGGDGVPRTAVWAEDASIAAGSAGAVLSLGTVLGAAWLAVWGVGIADNRSILLLAAIDVSLVGLAVAFRRLAVELARPPVPRRPPTPTTSLGPPPVTGEVRV